MSVFRNSVVVLRTRLRASRRQDLLGYSLTLVAFIVAVVVALPHLAAIVTIIAKRWDHPFELEWMEGGMLHHAMRVVEGRALYPEPGPEFMPFLYTPLYHWLGGFFFWLSEPGLPALRALSLCGTASSVGILVLLVRATTRSWALGIGAGLLFVGTFALNGRWFDIARVDSVALAFSLLSLLLVTGRPLTIKYTLSGVCVALAFLTKQSTLAIVPALGLYAIARHGWRGALSLTIPALVIAGGVTLVLMQSSDGWYWYYTMELPATHGMKNRESLVLGFWENEVLKALPILAVLAGIGIVFMFTTLLVKSTEQSRKAEYWLVLTSSLLLILGSYASRLHMGSFLNDLIPMHAGIIILATSSLGMLFERFPVPLLYWLAPSVFALHFFLGEVLEEARHVPSAGDRAAGNALVERLHDTPGDVLVINHPHFAILAGKPTWAHQMAMIDVFEAESDPRNVRELLRGKWEPLFKERRFETVIADNDWYVFQRPLMRNYRITEKLTTSRSALLPKTGTPFRPQIVLSPRPLRTPRARGKGSRRSHQ